MTETKTTDNGAVNRLLSVPHATLGFAGEEPHVGERVLFTGKVPSKKDLLPVLKLGKSLELESERKSELTLEAARKVLQLPEFIVEGSPVDRKLRDNHVTHLLLCMQRGTFRPEFVQIITCVCDEVIGDNPKGAEYRMNGQHTSWAREYMPESYSCPVKFLKYRAKTVQDMRTLYASIDRNAPRTRTNVLQTLLGGTSGFEGMSPRLIKSLCSGLNFYLSPPTGKGVGDKVLSPRQDPEELSYLMQTTYEYLVQRVREFLVSAPRSNNVARNKLEMTAVMGAIYATYDKVPTKATEFWAAVRDGVGFGEKDDPRLRLRDALGSSRIAKTSGRLEGRHSRGVEHTKRLAGPEDIYAWCIHAWNAWRKGQPLTRVIGATGWKRPTPQ